MTNNQAYQSILISLSIWLIPYILYNIIYIILTSLVVWLILYLDLKPKVLFKDQFIFQIIKYIINILKNNVINIGIDGLIKNNKVVNNEINIKKTKLKKLSVKELFSLCEKNNISLPKEGSGKNGSLVKKDIIHIISSISGI